MADRPAGVGADRAGREPARDRRGATTRGPARNSVRVPRVQHRAVAGVLVGGTHGELVHVRLAEHARASLMQLADGGRRIGRTVPLQDSRPGRGRDPLGAEDVLDGDGDAVEWAISARLLPASPGPLEVGLRWVLGSPQEGVQRVAGGRFAIGIEELIRGEIPGTNSRGRLRDRQIDQLDRHRLTRNHACGEGTRNEPPAGSGARSSTSSRDQLGLGLSGPKDVLQGDHV